MVKSILITRPNHDLITTYFFHWSIHVINIAQLKGFKIFDLESKRASLKLLTSYITEHNPTIVFINGHGNPSQIAGYDNEIIISGSNLSIFRDKIVYARSCNSALGLGLKMVKKGAKAFIGYKRKFWLAYLQSKISIPLSDKVARLFLEPSNLIPISLIKGNTVQNSFRKSQEAIGRNFRHMLSTRATTEQKDAAPYLWINMKYQTVIGNKSASVS